MYMADWEDRLNQFLRFNGQEVLQNFGSISRDIAEKLALDQYEAFDANRRRIEADALPALESSIKKIHP